MCVCGCLRGAWRASHAGPDQPTNTGFPPLRTHLIKLSWWGDGTDGAALSTNTNKAPLHTWDWEPVTESLQELSLVEKAEPVQVRFTLRLRDQWSTWMQDGWKVHMDSYMASNWSCFMVTWTISTKPSFGGMLDTKLRDHGIPNAHICWFILFYHACGSAWIEISWNSIWLRA
jgi:hypothetical protein